MRRGIAVITPMLWAVGFCIGTLAVVRPEVASAQTEACCALDGSCSDLEPGACAAGGGIPGGPGTSCAGNPDICTERPCCIGNVCVGIVAPQFCEAQGGTAQPLGSQCLLGAPCPEPNCVPALDGHSCSDVTCSTPGNHCQPRCTLVDLADGDYTVTGCSCRGTEECHVVLSPTPVGSPCTLPDNGTGTADMPPLGCTYIQSDGLMQISDGLPPGTTIAIDPQLGSFSGVTRSPGGMYGGEVEQFLATLQMELTGTGSLAGYHRLLAINNLPCTTNSEPRTPGPAVQTFEWDITQLQGQITGDPDFDLLRVTAGLELNDLPPTFGQTTLIQLPGGNWAVDSFFDIIYQIDFVGSPGGPLAGMSGSTMGYVRVQAGIALPSCAGGCPILGSFCSRTLAVEPDGSVSVCCDCGGGFTPVCGPKPDGSGCEPVACPDANYACVPVGYAVGGLGETIITACECRPFDACQVRGEPGSPQCTGPCLGDLTGTCGLIERPSGLRCDCLCTSNEDCDDGNGCTADQCDTFTGTCSHAAITCDDNSPCTTDACNPLTGQCEFTPINCDDLNLCTADSCDPASGECRHTPIDCDDADLCTIDSCNPADGSCLHVQIDCDDNDPCTADSCDSSLGIAICRHDPLPGCEPVAKWSQPPTADREDIASNVWITANGVQAVNKVVADDFRSDGRPIHAVQWWGSYLQSEYAPVEFGGAGQSPTMIDGWLISFHRPQRVAGGAPQPVLGLYFAPAEAVQIVPTNIVPCDSHPVFAYSVRLADCALLQSNPDVRVPVEDPCRCPAKQSYFCERACYWYELDIQAVVGVRWIPVLGSVCAERVFTPNSATADFWGWHATSVESGRHAALQSTVTLGPDAQSPCSPLDVCGPLMQWLYGPWSVAAAVCPFQHRINMSFALLTSVQQTPPACPSLVILSATSIKTHALGGGGSPTDYAINLPLAPPAGAGVEDRINGPTRVVLTFSQPIVADDGSLGIGDEVTTTGAIITGLSISGNELTVNLSGAANPSCVRLQIENGPDGITTVGSDDLQGDNDVHVRSLIGDVNEDGDTNIFDLVTVRNNLNAAVTGSNFRSDVNLDKAINIFDLVTVRNSLNLSVSCP